MFVAEMRMRWERVASNFGEGFENWNESFRNSGGSGSDRRGISFSIYHFPFSISHLGPVFQESCGSLADQMTNQKWKMIYGKWIL